MADTGWKFPGTVIGDRPVFDPEMDWINPDNAKADDGSDATATAPEATSTVNGLAATNFDFSSIPINSTINGIEVEIGDYFADVLPVTIGRVKLILADGTDGTADKGIDIAAFTTSLQTDQAGGSNDLWGDLHTVADVQDIDFGFWFNCTVHTSGAVASVDFVRMRIFFTPLPPTPRYRRGHIGFTYG